ncbi:tripartite motif-containing protein 2-like [Ptychodera flava]|uniref:tripartite motif-containing protein 2-like n=1 Tax=Ptychodera flava TaxID=63121 RepID=UPI003969E0DE
MPEMKAHSLKISQKVDELKLRMDRLYDFQVDLEENKSMAELLINSLCQSLFDEITKQRLKLLGEVEDLYTAKRKETNAAMELLEQNVASTESIHSYLNHLLTFGGAVDIITALKEMDQQRHYNDVTNVPRCDIDNQLFFTANQDCLQINLGIVEGSKTIRSEILRKDEYRQKKISHRQVEVQRNREGVTKQSGKIPLEVMQGRDVGEREHTQPKIPAKSMQKYRKPTRKVRQINLPGDWSKSTLKGQSPNKGQKFNNPSGLIFHDDKLLVCDKGNNIVQILNQDYTCEKVLGTFSGQFPKPFHPQSVVVSQDKKCFILDVSNLQIVVCDLNNTIIRIITLPEDTQPYCIALLKGFVLVTDIKRHKLLKYTKRGKFVSEVGGHGRGQTKFNYPYFVAVNSSDVIMVSDCFNNCIKCFDIEFNYLCKYGQFGDGNGQLDWIGSIAFDGDDMVYACDYGNGRIVKWSCDGNRSFHGRWICNMFQDDVDHPWYIAVSRDRICVRGDSDEDITVFSR